MKIGILILAHNNPEQLQLLVDSLKKDFQVYIHLDAKSNLLSEQFTGGDNVYIVKKYPVYWGHITQIKAIIHLLRLAYKDNCDYYIHISGTDVKIQSNEEIIKQIQDDATKNYLNFQDLPRSDWPLNGGFDRLHFYWWDKLKSPGHTSILSNIYSLSRKLQQMLRLQRKLLPMTYYGGALWFNLSKEVVGYIFDFIDQTPGYLKQFKYTRCADEIFFHTIIMNSKYSAKVENDSKRYIDWKTGPQYPRILTMEDYERIKKSGAFFARKFDMRIDVKVIEKLMKNS